MFETVRSAGMVVLEPRSLTGSRQDAGTLDEGLVQSSAAKEKAVGHVISERRNVYTAAPSH